MIEFHTPFHARCWRWYFLPLDYELNRRELFRHSYARFIDIIFIGQTAPFFICQTKTRLFEGISLVIISFTHQHAHTPSFLLSFTYVLPAICNTKISVFYRHYWGMIFSQPCFSILPWWYFIITICILTCFRLQLLLYNIYFSYLHFLGYAKRIWAQPHAFVISYRYDKRCFMPPQSWPLIVIN